MNYIAEWDAAHQERLMIATEPDPRLVEFAATWTQKDHGAVKWLDIGCGTGRSAEYLSSQGFDVCAFDSSINAIMRALHRMTESRNNRIPRFMVSDLTKPWPYRAASFHAMVDIRSLENLNMDEIRFAWSQAARALCGGGRFLSICASPLRDDALTTAGRVTKLSAEDVAALVSGSGFTAEVQMQQCVHENGKIVEDWQIIATRK